MSDLPISGMLDVAVDQASLRASQQEIEENVGQLSMGVDAGGGQMSTRGVEGREQAMARALATEANDIAEEQAEWLELIYLEISDAGSSDLFDTGEGGGVFGVLRDFGDDAGDVGGAAALTGAAAALTASAKTSTGLHAGAAAALTTAAGSLMASNLFGDNGPLHVEVPDELDPVSVDTPTLGVDDPSPLTVDGPTLGVDDPSPLGVDPDYIAPVDDTAIPVDVTVDITGGVSEPNEPSTQLQPADDDDPDFFRRVGQGATTGALVGGGIGLKFGGVGAIPGAAGGGLLGAGGGALAFAGESLLGNDVSLPGPIQDRQRSQPVNRTRTGDSTPAEINVEVTSNNDFNADVDRVMRQLRRERDRELDEIERRLRDIERKFDRV